ncbi:MAG TPA: hypothetical protein VFK05_10720 [Polyangiaceae bacterium]|nr:hypothetical protein [Polyangiaceae bacterium]
MKRCSPLPRPALAVSACVAALALTSRSTAESDSAAAEALFQEGRALLKKGRVDEACPKLADSLRLDMATGTLVALALCHEQQKKYASAWAEFTSAAARAKREGRTDREKLANERAAALKPRLSSLTVEVPDEVRALPGLEVTRDDAVLGESAWNSSVPIDGGEHSLRVRAAGKTAWEKRVTVKDEGDAVTVQVPTLKADVSRAEPGPPASAAASHVASTPSEPEQKAKRPWGTLEWAGVGTASAGVVALGVGGYFLASALSKNSASKDSCTGDTCVQPGYDQRMSAYEKGNLATVFGIGGAALVGVGASLFIVGRTRSKEDTSARSGPELRVVSDGRSVTFSGRF